MVIRVLAIVWLALIGASVYLPTQTQATGDGFTRGTNRIGVFLAWHGVALVGAIVIRAMGRRSDEPSWLVSGPLMVHGLVGVGLVIYTIFQLTTG